ncbi:MAG: preprotein translocase subunit YajC [bacterium]|nr:preprotein translocase subunit YajC [bacterium]
MTSIALAQTSGTTGTTKTAPGGAFGMFLPMILVFVIFYFLMIRPQQKQQKKHRQMLGEVKKGDEVVTSSGLYGKIYAVTDATVTLEVSENSRLRFDKQHIARLIK